MTKHRPIKTLNNRPANRLWESCAPTTRRMGADVLVSLAMPAAPIFHHEYGVP